MYLKIIKNFSFYAHKEKRKLLNLFPFINKNSQHKIPKISAYLSIYNDGDILDIALKSIASYVDELIVVDGAYEWMAPFLEATGRNPLRSEDIVYEKIASSGIPYKVISKVWKNEVEKRVAGFEATSGRYVIRIDADECLFFEEQALRNFFKSGCAVAEMYMPNYAAPGWVIQGTRLIDKLRIFPRQSLLFDREKISAVNHLRYLWLVLTADELPSTEKKQKIFSVFEKPVAFCAHLTNWRFVESSATRSSFYTMNWMRQNGAPWVSQVGSRKIENFNEFFSYVPPKYFLEIMKNGVIVQGDLQLKKHEKLSRTPLSSAQESIFSNLYLKFLSKLQEQTLKVLKEGGFALSGYAFYLDISLQETLAKVAPDGHLNILFSEPISGGAVSIKSLMGKIPHEINNMPSYKVGGGLLSIELSDISYSDELLRKSVEIIVESSDKSVPWFKYQIMVGHEKRSY